MVAFSLTKLPNWKKKPLLCVPKQHAKTILITGATGFIGQSLCRRLLKEGNNLIVLSRKYKKADNLFGPHVETINNLDKVTTDRKIDAIISLAGAPVATRIWTKKRKKILLDSRINDLVSIDKLCQRLKLKPRVLINASAIGYYGIRDNTILTEQDTGQPIYQSQLCQQKEDFGLTVEQFGTRVCNLRIGLVFANDGGAYRQLRWPIKLGLGSILGDGQQWISWIHKPDLLRIILFLLKNGQLSGPVNATAPVPVTNEVFTKKVAKHYNKPVLFRIPAFLVRTVLGELAQLFLKGQRVIPEKLLKEGFSFRQSNLAEMLAAIDKVESVKTDGIIELYYNAAHPMSQCQITWYQNQAKKHNQELIFHDISSKKINLESYQICFDDLKRRMYVKNKVGDMYSGIDAFLLIWQKLPSCIWLYRLIRLPVIYHCADLIYEIMIVPCAAIYNRKYTKIIN